MVDKPKNPESQPGMTPDKKMPDDKKQKGDSAKEANPKLSRKDVKRMLMCIQQVFDKRIQSEKDFAKMIDKGTLQEIIDNIRIGSKYCVFDCEAARREIKYLKKLLDENHIDY